MSFCSKLFMEPYGLICYPVHAVEVGTFNRDLFHVQYLNKVCVRNVEINISTLYAVLLSCQVVSVPLHFLALLLMSVIRSILLLISKIYAQAKNMFWEHRNLYFYSQSNSQGVGCLESLISTSEIEHRFTFGKPKESNLCQPW